jgi:Uma2 family endonuclease
MDEPWSRPWPRRSPHRRGHGRVQRHGPDLLWIAEEHRPSDLTRRLVRVPDLCVEIRAPSTWRYDIGAKNRVYEAGGLPELWLVDDVSEAVYAFRRSKLGLDRFDLALELARGDVLTSPMLPGFALELDGLFDFTR